jgi:nitrite reductase (NADH) small subunit
MDTSNLSAWTHICTLSDIPPLGSRVLERPEGNIAIFRTGTDRVFALLDRCPHKNGALSQGIVHGEAVTCPLHSWTIELDSGMARAPDQGCARHFPVRLDGDAVYLELA